MTLHCPGCDRPLAEDVQRCPYCHAPAPFRPPDDTRYPPTVFVPPLADASGDQTEPVPTVPSGQSTSWTSRDPLRLVLIAALVLAVLTGVTVAGASAVHRNTTPATPQAPVVDAGVVSSTNAPGSSAPASPETTAPVETRATTTSTSAPSTTSTVATSTSTTVAESSTTSTSTPSTTSTSTTQAPASTTTAVASDSVTTG